MVLFVVKCEQTLLLDQSRSLLNTLEFVEVLWIGRILVDRDNTILTKHDVKAFIK